MVASHLKIYCGPEESTGAEVSQSPSGQRNVTLQMRDVLPLLADAVRSERTWLKDFDSDEVTISTDLYEVLLAYQHYRLPSA